MDAPAPWRKLSGELIHDHMLKVEEHVVRNAGGREFAVPVVRCPQASVVLAITVDNKVAVVRQHRYAADVRTWELPSGVVDPGRTPEQTAIAELHEEAQLRPGQLRGLGMMRHDPSLTDEVLHLYLATECVHDPDAGPDDECVAEFLDFADVLDLAYTEQMPPFSALVVLRYAYEARP